MAKTIRCKYCGKGATQYQNRKIFCTDLCGSRYRARGYSRDNLILKKNREFILSNIQNRVLFEMLTT